MGDLLIRLAIRESQQQRSWSAPCRFRFVRDENGIYRLETKLVAKPAKPRKRIRRDAYGRPHAVQEDT